jgi:DNA polymerase IV
MEPSRKIIHIDMDAFFASVEQLDTPSLKGKPVIVGGDPTTRGVVAACSYEARRFGVHSAMPCRKAYQLCKHAHFIRPRMYRYTEISQQIMTIFREYTDLVEPLSVDEAFLDVTSNYKDCASASILAENIRKDIFHKTGLTASAGVSYNKFLAKVASDIHKPNGLTVITPDKALDFLSQLPVGAFYGVGKVTEKKMLSMGIKDGKTLRKYHRADLIHHFGKAGSFFYNIVRGQDHRPVVSSRNRKSIGSETTLKQDSRDIHKLRQILNDISEKIGEGLKNHKCGASTLTLKVRYFDFKTVTRSITFFYPIFTAEEIRKSLPDLISKTELGETPVRLVGLSISKLTTSTKSSPRQLMLPFMHQGPAHK